MDSSSQGFYDRLIAGLDTPQRAQERRAEVRRTATMADYRNEPDLPSHMTVAELRTLSRYVERLLPHVTHGVDSPAEARRNEELSILVRDRGGQSPIVASWIEFSLGGKEYGIWRATLHLYEADEHGAMSEDPIMTPDDV